MCVTLSIDVDGFNDVSMLWISRSYCWYLSVPKLAVACVSPAYLDRERAVLVLFHCVYHSFLHE
jgi:hypothetical protein